MTIRYGLILEPLAPEDFVLGSDRSLETKFGRAPLNPSSDWSQWLPPYEPQAPVFETNACTSFGTLNALEILKRFLFKREPDFSDRMLAKGSGTDARRGNTPKAVAEYIRKNWTAYENEWPTLSAKSVEEFYTELPQDLKTLAIGRGAEWSFGYEWVSTSPASLREALKYSPLGISVPAWFKDPNGQYYRPQGVQDTHWVCAFAINDKNELKVLDTYEPYIKTMRADFLPQVAYSYYLNRQIQNEQSWVQFLVSLVLSFWKPETVPPTIPLAYPAEKLIATAKSYIGKDASPLNEAPPELACAETLSFLLDQTFGNFKRQLSTIKLNEQLAADPRFIRTTEWKAGNIVISPTLGKRVGHCGVILEDGRVANNNSFTGRFEVNYTQDKWRQTFVPLQTLLYAPTAASHDV